MAASPLLFLDNDSLLRVLQKGTFKIEPIGFEEARAIIDMHAGPDDIVCCFADHSLQQILYDYLDIPKRNLQIAQNLPTMEIEQDAIIFRRYVTESETRPIIKTEFGNEAKKIQNVYLHCEFLSRIG